MNTESVSLDGEELFYLALKISKAGQHEEAIVLLKRLLAQQPENARALYLLGAEHAEIGLYDRAKDEMKRAVDLDPSMHAARFQLGLLFVSSGQVEQGLAVLEPLCAASNNEPFFSFACGLKALVHDKFAECRDALKRGIAENKTNEPLNDDMCKILDAIADKVADKPTSASEAAEDGSWLSAYRSTGDR